jgi:tRNA G10  N-methylase Trm11
MSQKNSSDNVPSHFFVLGREWRLSIAELCSVFGSDRLQEYDERIALFSGLSDEEIVSRFASLGGSIFAGRISSDHRSAKRFDHVAIARLVAGLHAGRSDKILFSLSTYPQSTDLFERALGVKKRLRKLVGEGIALRSVNAEKEGNPSAVPIRKQGVLDKGYAVAEFTVAGGEYRLGTFIAAQDVDEYAKRDTERVRDMKVGMLPPKLAQIMCNLAGVSDRVYDPFCGLGTVLIEASTRGAAVYGSDAAEAMVRSSRENLVGLGQDGSVDTRVFRLDATRIAEIGERVPHDTPIVTEGTLGPVLSQSTVSRVRVAEIDGELAKLYDRFFAGLREIAWSGRVVLSFPCFRIERADVSADRCIEAFARHGFVAVSPLPEELRDPTRRGILYRRPDQTVGREIFVLELSK